MNPASRPGLGRAMQDGLRAFTPAVRVLVIACVAVWLFEVLGGGYARAFITHLWLQPSAVVGKGWVWQLLTFQFLHDPAGLGHVGWNMYSLWLFGRWLEERWGTRSFVAFYLTCGLGGGVLHVLLALVGLEGAQAPVIGASAGIMGLFAAAAMIWPHRRILLLFVIPIELRFAALLFAIMTFGMAFTVSGVAAFAHLGGMATGWAYLKWGWRLEGLGRPFVRAWAAVRDLPRRWRRRNIKVVDREFDEWLRRETDDEETRH